MAHPLFGPECQLMLEEGDTAGMKALCESVHPATAAEALADFDVENVWKFLDQTDIKSQAAIFEYFPIETQVKLVEGTGRPRMARLIEKMSHDDRVDLMRRLMPRVADELVRLVDEADRRDIATLRSYPENSAGALMTTDYAWVPPNITVGEALDRLRLQAPDRETIYYVYVLDDQRKMLGVLSLRDLILAQRYARIRDLMETEAIAVRVTDNRQDVARIMAQFDLLAIPVIDDEDRLVGIVTHDDVMDVVVQKATEDAQRMGAVGAITENYLEAGFTKIWRKRAGWLSCLFIAGIFTILAMASFQDTVDKVLVLSIFIPLCIGTGGNSGSQAATLITRAMALGQVSLHQWFQVLRHELLMGIALGATLSVIGMVIAFLIPDSLLHNSEGHKQVEHWQLSLVVAQAIFAVCIWGTVVGSMLPLAFRRLGFDPAFASSPFVAMFVDVTGILIYFTIAILWIPALRASG